ncbi:MAG: hypothetical protein KDB01_22525 [Planctomycetaceae bacterium]|nr:hypothetical protein [Planctomycetaceae bacterium]
MKFVHSTFCAVLTIAMASAAIAQQKPEEISLELVPAVVMKTAIQVDKQAEWPQALWAPSPNSGGRLYALKGRILIRAERQTARIDGDVDITPAEYQFVEVGVLEDGQLNYVVKRVPLETVPENVTTTLRTKIEATPLYAYIARTSIAGDPLGYIFEFDEIGLLRYFVTTDAKTAGKL